MKIADKENKEYGGQLYTDENGGFGATVNIGDATSVDVNGVEPPKGATVYADWHLHQKGNHEIYSPADIAEANVGKYPGSYLGSNDGNVYYYQKGTLEPSLLRGVLQSWEIRKVITIVGESYDK